MQLFQAARPGVSAKSVAAGCTATGGGLAVRFLNVITKLLKLG